MELEIYNKSLNVYKKLFSFENQLFKSCVPNTLISLYNNLLNYYAFKRLYSMGTNDLS